MSEYRGISIEKIYARCEERGDCRIWQGAQSASRGKGTGTPCMYVRDLPGKRVTLAVRRVVYNIKRGQDVPEEKVLGAKCGNRLCVSEHCIEAMTMQQTRQIAAQRGAYRNPAKARKGMLTIRAKSWITEEMVTKIKDARTAKEASEETTVSLSHCKAIRRGVARRDITSPFTCLTAFAYIQGSPAGTHPKAGRSQGDQHG